MNEVAELLTGGMTRSKMVRLEAELAKLPHQLGPAIQMRHYWAPGIYAREMFIPAGACLTGKIHLHENLSFVLGDITVSTEEGQRRVTGYQVVLAPAGVKRAAVTHSDTWWTTIHPNPTNERDLDKLASMFVVTDFEEFDAAIGVLA